MYTEHPSFVPPPRDATLWRYLDFTKFVSLLDKGALFFARSDKLGDPFEGSFPKRNIELRPELFSENFPGFPLGPHVNSMAEFVKESRKYTLINCWHQSQHESAAMWKLYARERDGLAVKTDFASLAESLLCEDDIYIGEVTYIDYESASIKENNAIAPFLFKRDSFEHEKEVRALYWDINSYMAFGDSTSDSGNPSLAPGEYIKVDVSKLIKEVLVAPYAEDWFIKLAQSVARRFGLEVSVSKSKLDQEPTWS